MLYKMPGQKNTELLHFALPAFVFLVGTVAAFYFFYLIRELDRQKTTVAFEQAAHNYHNAVSQELNANLELLASIKAFIENAGEVSQQNFSRYSSALLANHGNVQALEWIPRIHHKDRRSHEKSGQSQGFPSYYLKERNAQKELGPAIARSEYFPVFLVYPIVGNGAAIGFNLASNPAREAALYAARDSGNPVMTGRITLVQEKASQAGLLVFQALYKNSGTPGTIEERRENLVGFALIVIRAGDMINKSLRELPPHINLSITDQTDGNNDIIFGEQPPLKNGERTKHQAIFATRNWSFTATPKGDAFDFSTPLTASLSFIVAMITAGLASLFVFRLLQENLKIAKEVDRQTYALKSSEERFDLAVKGSAVGLWDWNIETGTLYWSPHLLELLAIRDPNFTPCGDDFERRIHPTDRQTVLDAVRAHIEKDEAYDVIYRLRRETGHYAWIHARGLVLRTADGLPIRMAGSMDDVSDKHVLEKVLKANKHELQMIFDNVPARIWYKDDKNNILRLNRQAAESMGIQNQDIEGGNVADLVPETTVKNLQDDREVIRSGKPQLGVIEKYTHFNQEPTWVRTDKVPFVDPITGQSHILISSIDITVQIKAEMAKESAIDAHSKTAAELQVILNTVVDGLLIINRKGIIQQINTSTTTIFGYEDSELIGKNVSCLMPERYSNNHDGYLEHYLQTGDAKVIGIGRDDIAGLRKNGQEFPMSLGVGQIEGGGKEMVFVGTVRDISKQVLAAKKLKQSEERFYLAAKGSSVGIWDRPDVNEITEYWSPQYYRLLGYEDGEIEATLTNFRGMLHEEDRERVFVLLEAHYKKHATFDIDFRLRTKKEGYRWFRGSGQASWDENGAASRMVGAIQDIHAQKTAELDIRAYALDLQRSNADLEQFAYVASHDLKAPLRGIHNLAEWIEENIKDTIDEETSGYLDMLKSRVTRLENLLAGLLTYSKIGSAEAPHEDVDMNGLLHDIGELLLPVGGGLKLEYDLPKIYTPETEIHQILQNLISNSVKHHDKENGTIKVSYAISDSRHLFTIEDDGPGIPEDLHDKVFMMFQTLKPRDEIEGSGMGLAIVKKLVERRKGSIWIETTGANHGTVIKFTLAAKERPTGDDRE